MTDAGLFHQMMVTAFTPLLERYRDYETSPASMPLERIQERFQERDSDFFLILSGEIPIGGLRTVEREDGRRLSPIFILPEYQGRGYAQQAVSLAESLYPQVRKWFLDTIKQEPKLRHLYEKMGYHWTGEENQIKDGMSLVFYEKTMKG